MEGTVGHILQMEIVLKNGFMGLRESDKEYMKICEGTIEDRVKYCENLISRMRNRLKDDNSNMNNIRTLMLEMIESAESELEMLRSAR